MSRTDVPIFGTVAGGPPDGRWDAESALDSLIGVAGAAASRHYVGVASLCEEGLAEAGICQIGGGDESGANLEELHCGPS